MTLNEIIDRLTGIDDDVFFDNPYARARGTPQGDIVAALESLDEDSDAEDVKLLFLLDYSREVQAMSGNFGQELTDDEAADRAEQFWSENFEQVD